MIIKSIIAGIYEENCYIIMDEVSKDLAIIDPGGSADLLEKEIDALNGNVKYILLTHGHFDHVGAVEYLADKYNIPFYINKNDEEWMKKDKSVFVALRKADGYLEDGDKLNFGDTYIKVITTPGHTKGGVCFLINNHMFTGDTLFRGSVGRSDFPGGDFTELINSIKTKLLILDEDIEVYPGHGPSSTIGFEKDRNPYCGF